MRVSATLRGKSVAKRLSDRQTALVSHSLERFEDRIEEINLFIEDINGPRGGIDKQCRCVLQLKKLPSIVIRDNDSDLDSLLHRVSNRATHALRQKVDRVYKQSRRKESPSLSDTDRLDRDGDA